MKAIGRESGDSVHAQFESRVVSPKGVARSYLYERDPGAFGYVDA